MKDENDVVTWLWATGNIIFYLILEIKSALCILTDGWLIKMCRHWYSVVFASFETVASMDLKNTYFICKVTTINFGMFNCLASDFQKASGVLLVWVLKQAILK